MKISRKALFVVVEQFVLLQLCLVTLGEPSEDMYTSAISTGTDAVATVVTMTTEDAVSSAAATDALKTCPSVCICSMFKREIPVDLGNASELRVRVICRNRRIDNLTQLIRDDLPNYTVYL